MAELEDCLVFDDQENSNSEIVEEIPQEERKILTQAYDKSVVDIVRMIGEGDIRLDPEYQRNYVWDNKKASLLIESIILSVPIPVIYVSQEKDDTWTVIDGLQRLYTLKRFFNGEFKLTGLEILKELNKCDIKTLNHKALRILKNGLLRVIMITNDSNEEIKYDIFMRLNRGSVHLTEQELRNCLYRGSLNDLLKILAENKKWQALLGLRMPHKRMADRELELRFFAIKNSWDETTGEVKNYKGRMKSFLNDFMNQNKNIAETTKDEWQFLFTETVEKVYSIFGDMAFKRINVDSSRENSINRAIMDVLLLSVTPYPLSVLQSRAQLIKTSFESLVKEDVNFRNSIQIATSDTKVLNYRLSTWCGKLKLIINEMG